jgi:hypothetical protein
MHFTNFKTYIMHTRITLHARRVVIESNQTLMKNILNLVA